MWKRGIQPVVYLAGAIENAPDAGRKWREDISFFLTHELNHQVFNPTLEENHILTPFEFRNFRHWKTADLPRFRQVVHKIIKTDIGMLINQVDYIICLWDEYVSRGGGTQGELTIAFWKQIPVYMVTTLPLTDLSSWIIGCTSEIFYDFDSLKEFLKSTYLHPKK
ncbi:MAG: hypothetical protein EH225_11805 [Calditrichaeota bacterium]|nr:MAG: hypothetical protein EH225_11805 [Calditrichota bacterium]